MMNYVLAGIISLLIFYRPIGTWAYKLNIRWLYIILLSALITYFLTPIVIKLANRFKWLDYPDERKIHTIATPRVGGIAIFVSIVLTLLRNLQFSKEIVGVLLASSIIFCISLIDDIKGVPAIIRLVTQIIATGIIIYFGYQITVVPRNWLFENVFEILITIIWFVGIVNAINFMDGIDGLVTSYTIFSSLTFLVITILTGQKFLIYIISSLLGSCLGFLPYNWHKAKIFLGDCGATILGFLLATISVVGWWGEKNPVVSLSTPILILSVPIYDMVYITISRIKNKTVKNFKQWIEYVGKDHLHHRLVSLNFNIPSVVGIIVLISLCLDISVLVLRYTPAGSMGSILLLLQAMIVFVVISIIMVTGKQKI